MPTNILLIILLCVLPPPPVISKNLLKHVHKEIRGELILLQRRDK